MTLTSIFPIALAALMALLVFALVRLRKSPPNPKARRYLQLFGVVCALVSALAIGAAFYFSRDITQLCKLALPGCILVLIVVQMREGKAKL